MRQETICGEREVSLVYYDTNWCGMRGGVRAGECGGPALGIVCRRLRP